VPELPPSDLPSPSAGALLLGLLDDASLLGRGAVDAAATVAAHRALREGADAALVGPLDVQVSALGALLDALDAAPSSTPLGVRLVADTGLVEAAEARAVLLDDDRVEVSGLVVALPADGPLGESAALTLESLDFALPSVVEVPDAPGWADAVAVIAEDGAERVGLRVGDRLAEMLHQAVGCGAAAALTSPVRAAVHDGTGPGVLNVIGAVAEALGGGDVSRVAAALSERDVQPLLAIVASADPRRVRGRLTAVASADPAATLAGLRDLGLLEEDDTP
jgi:hypothetical protein